MAEIQTSSNHAKRGGIRSKKLSTRVDLTPMVDLGFLLITFFIFTTTMSQPNVMRLIMSDDRDLSEPPKAPESKTLSFILGGDNTIYYYQGLDAGAVKVTDYSPTGIRTIIQEKIKALAAHYKVPGQLIVLIKPTRNANYKNVVDVLDEMTINEVRKYMLLEPDDKDLRVIKI